MSKLDRLIEELCPDGVEYKELWKVTTWDKNFNRVANYKQERTIKYYHKTAIELKRLRVDDGNVKILFTGSTDSGFTTEKLADKIISKGEIVAIPWGGTPWVQYYKGRFITGDNRIATSSNLKILNNKYLYYVLKNNIKTIGSFYRGSGIKHPDMVKVLDYQIPLPPLPVQEEIVRILDNFTELTAELTAELTSRRKQYEYYRDELLTFGDEVEWKTLEEVGEIGTGATPSTKNSKYWTNGTIPWMSSGEVNKKIIHSTEKFITPLGYEKSSTKIIPKNAVVIALAGQGKTRGQVAITEIELCTNQSLAFIIPYNTINSYYLYYYMLGEYHKLRHISSGDGTRGGLNLKMIRNYKIPIPPLSEQERIVSILDKFDALVNDISIGLPAEIEARQKQYEYYREKLLTFKELETKET